MSQLTALYARFTLNIHERFCCIEDSLLRGACRSRRRHSMTESRDMNRSMLVSPICEAALAVSVRQFGQPSLEESPFRFLLRETEGSFVGVSGFRCSSQSPAEICPRRMDQVIVP